MEELTQDTEKGYVDESKLVKFVDDQLKKCHKEAYEQQIYLNISYFAGKQWIKIDRTTNQLVEPPMEAWQVRYTANKIQPIVRTEHAKVTKNKFTMYVNPASSDDNDVKSARVAERLVDWLEYDLSLQEKDRELCLWMLNAGIAFKKPFWNPAKGGIVTPDGMREGGPDSCVVSLFELRFDTSYTKWDELPWICHEKIRTVDYIKQTYGKEVKAEAGLTATNLYEAKLAEVVNNGFGVAYKKLENSAVVHEYWELPTADYPKGRRITTCGETVLYYEEDIGFGENDTTERELPFIPCIHIAVPGRLIPTCVVEQLIPVQREYNRSRSMIKEHINLYSSPPLLIPKGCIDDEITNMPGQVIEYTNVGSKPEYMSVPPMTSDTYKDLEYADSEFEFISGQHETSHGQTPTGVTSGTAIGYLQEQDDTKLGPTIANFVACKQKYMKYLLKMIRYKCTTERTITIAGNNKKSEVLSFAGSDLTSIDVRVLEATMNQKSKAAMRDLILSLVQYGFLLPTNEHDKQVAMKALEFGIIDDVFIENEQDVSQAQIENDKWAAGDTTPIVRDFYNHDAHVKEHNKFRKGEAYAQLPPETMMTIDQHVQLHMQFVLQQLLATMPQQTPDTPQTPQPQSNNSETPALI